MKMVLLLCLSLWLGSCASGYSEFYTQMAGATPEAIASTRAAPAPENPLVEHSPTFPSRDQYLKMGYAMIGYSSFNSGSPESERNAVAQGKKVGADLVVVVNPSFTGSVTSSMPITTPTTSTSTTSSTATAFGTGGGTATAFGNSVTTTTGSQTTYVTITVNRFDYGAVYFVKQFFALGVITRELDSNEKSLLQSNAGVVVESVVTGTPAFRNDVLEGDIIQKVDGVPIYGVQSLGEYFAPRRGMDVVLTIYRNGKILDKQIKLAQ